MQFGQRWVLVAVYFNTLVLIVELLSFKDKLEAKV